jgi:hypothetical protein
MPQVKEPFSVGEANPSEAEDLIGNDSRNPFEGQFRMFDRWFITVNATLLSST